MDELAPSPFGVLLRRHRLEAGFTQAELAERAGISTDAISTLERGVRRNPHRDTLRLLSDALELGPGDRTLFEEAAMRASTTSPYHSSMTSEFTTGDFLGALPSSGPLLARDEEVEQVGLILKAVADGAGQVLLLAGELGVGKTRLAQEAMIEAISHGFVVGVGRCYQTEHDTPYYSFLEAMAGTTTRAPLGVRADIERRSDEIQRLMSGAAVREDRGTTLEEQRRVFTTVADYLATLGRVSPVALLLDDLQWVDSHSLKLFQHLTRTTQRNRTLLLGTVRDTRLHEEHPELAEAIQDLGRERLLQRMIIRRLSVDETTALVTALVGQVSDDFAEFVHRRTKGNPRFIRELVESLGGRLHLLREIGAGATGRVFEARDSKTGNMVAAKILVARGGIQSDVLLRFQQEGAMLAALTHPNIVDIHDSFTDEHVSCIVMELLDGNSLGTLLRDGPLPLPRAKHILLQVAVALEYAHSHAIAHRDIKPDNIMVLENERVKVTDFGIARIVQPEVTVQTIATTGMRLGTPLYMAPEQIEGGRVDGRSDIYSYGAVLYHVATGHPPFEGEDPLAIAIKHLQQDPQPPRELNPNLPGDWQAAILKALAKDPARRFQTAGELKTAIESLSIEPGSRHEHSSRRSLLRTPSLIAIAGSVMVALVIAAILVRARSPAQTPFRIASTCVPALVISPLDQSLDRAIRTGFLRAAAKLGVRNPPMYDVQPTGDYAEQLRRAAAQRPCVVVVGGLLQSNVLTGVSEHYPGIHFVLVDAITLDATGAGYVNRPNVEDQLYPTQESGYLVGYLAGLMEKMKVGKAIHGTIGVMGGIPEPQVDSYIHGYVEGARAAYPRIKVLSAYANTFVDPSAGLSIGLKQIAGGADILFGVAGGTDTGYIAAARRHGVYAIGVDTDRSSLGQFVLTSALKRYSPGVYGAILNAAQGRFKGGIQQLGLKHGGTGIGRPSSLVPGSIVAMVNAQARQIASGKLTPQP